MLGALLKKWWVIGGVGALIVGVLGIQTTVGILQGGRRVVREAVQDLVPLEVDLKNLYASIEELDPAIRAAQRQVAQLEVDVEYQEKNLAALREAQEKSLAEMKKLRGILAEERETYEIGGRQYTRQELDRDLGQRLERFKLGDAEQKAKEELLKQHKERLDSAKQKLNEFRHQREMLVAKAESLQSQLELLRSQQAIGSVKIDDSKMASMQQLAENVERRIKVLARTLEEEKPGEIPVDVDTRSAVEKFDELFGAGNP